MLDKDFTSFARLTTADLADLLVVAHYLKARQRRGVVENALAGRTLAMVFEKPSLRTRVSFEVGMRQLGGHALYLSRDEVGLGKREPVGDVARVLSRYVQGIMIRTFSHAAVDELAAAADIPVINGLCDHVHPCQALADAMTIEECHGGLAGRRVVFIGDGNNVARSLARVCHLTGATFVLACPEQYAFTAEDAAEFGEAWGGSIIQVHDPREAAAGADILYTDVWVSMGQEGEKTERLAAFAGYQINANLIAEAGPDVRIMHCLPAHREEEIDATTIDDERSVIFDQAENRLHAQKAVLRLLMADDRAAVITAARDSRTR